MKLLLKSQGLISLRKVYVIVKSIEIVLAGYESIETLIQGQSWLNYLYTIDIIHELA